MYYAKFIATGCKRIYGGVLLYHRKEDLAKENKDKVLVVLTNHFKGNKKSFIRNIWYDLLWELNGIIITFFWSGLNSKFTVRIYERDKWASDNYEIRLLKKKLKGIDLKNFEDYEERNVSS